MKKNLNYLECFDEKYTMDQFEKLVAIDSTTSYNHKIESYIESEIKKLGFKYFYTHKGGIIADLGGEGHTLVLSAHLDDIGFMVRKINPDGTLNLCTVGGLYPFYTVGENVRIYNREDKMFTGTVCRTPSSVHVTEEELRDVPGDFRKNVCVVLDEDVKTAEDTRKLGIETGDMIALEPRFVYTNGYVKSRFVDDKACVAVLLNVMKYIKDKKIKLNRKVLVYFACYEEIGHGTTFLPEGVEDFVALDIAPTGPDQTSDVKKVSIFAKDSRYPYHWDLTNELKDTAKEARLDYVMDIFTPHYGSDGDGSIQAGYDIRHAAIGPGTDNSHGYERTHIEGLKNTFALTLAYTVK